jgi:hypothetical protein
MGFFIAARVNISFLWNGAMFKVSLINSPMRLHTTWILVYVLIISCRTGTNVTNSWTSKDAPRKPLQKVIIVPLMPDDERTFREKVGQQLATNFAGEGYITTTAYAEYGPKAFDKLSETQALKKISGSNIDGVLIVTLLDQEKEKQYTSGSVSYNPITSRQHRLWNYYTTSNARVNSSGYYSKDPKYFIETNLYDVKGNKLLYAAQSETFDRASADKLASNYAKAIVENMQEHNLLLKNHKVEEKK